jgi:hypothetical protein
MPAQQVLNPALNRQVEKQPHTHPQLHIDVKKGTLHVEDACGSLVAQALLHGRETALRGRQDGLQPCNTRGSKPEGSATSSNAMVY